MPLRFALALAALTLLPAPAFGAVRAGSADDPQDVKYSTFDPNPPVPKDLQRVEVDYDDVEGQVRFAITFFSPQESTGENEHGFGIHAKVLGCVYDESRETEQSELSLGLHRSINRNTGIAQVNAYASVSDVMGSLIGTTSISQDARTFTAVFKHAQLAGRDWRCVESPRANTDEFDSFWFRGYEPIAAVATPTADPTPPAAPAQTPAKPSGPQGCTKAQGDTAAREQLLPALARRTDFFDGVDEDWWTAYRVKCVDLTGDGEREMVVQLVCCTGGTPTPWGIFKHDSDGQWRLAYAPGLDNAYKFWTRGRNLYVRIVARYEGACTSVVRNRIVRWQKDRFKSRLTRKYKSGRGCPR